MPAQNIARKSNPESTHSRSITLSRCCNHGGRRPSLAASNAATKFLANKIVKASIAQSTPCLCLLRCVTADYYQTIL